MNGAKFIATHSRWICLGLALTIAAILSLHAAVMQMLPIADGQGYAIRNFALYGFLRTGQWTHFWKLLSRPTQAVLPPHDLLFFLLPRALAGPGSYLILQYATAYLILAYAINLISQLLHRPEWAPFVLLLCGVNNIVLTDFYTYYLDMTLFAVGLLAMAFQMKAWNDKRDLVSMASGVMLALVFWCKPANALIFLAVYILAEIIYAINSLRSGETPAELVRAYIFKLLGFLPVVGLAFLCGAGQTILQLIDQNEVSRMEIGVQNGGLLRLLYFPLCLSIFYHVILLGGLLLVAAVWSKMMTSAPEGETPTPFPARLLIPNLIAYFLLGEFFSFWMLAKPMRALLLVLPLFWFAFCWLWERQKLRMGPLFFAAFIYSFVAFSQKEFNLMRTKDQLVEANYSLTTASWFEMPSEWFHRPSLSRSIVDIVSHDVHPSGIICVSAIEIRNALAWRLQRDAFLDGKTPPYDVRYLFNYKGEYYYRSLVGANAIALLTFSPAQSSRQGWLQSMALLSYGDEAWCGANPIAHHRVMPEINGEPIGHEFIFDRPLTAAEVDQANQSAALASAPKDESGINADSIYGKQFSWKEGWDLLRAWVRKRLG